MKKKISKPVLIRLVIIVVIINNQFLCLITPKKIRARCKEKKTRISQELIHSSSQNARRPTNKKNINHQNPNLVYHKNFKTMLLEPYKQPMIHYLSMDISNTLTNQMICVMILFYANARYQQQ